MVIATNNKAESERVNLTPGARSWVPLTRNELLVFIGVLLYAGRSRIPLAEELWAMDRSVVHEYMGRVRFQQIKRYLTINPAPGPEPCSTWWQKLEPVASTIRDNCQRLVTPPGYCTVDELMIAFSGRSVHIIKIKNKPVKEGFKVWAWGFKGYIRSWLWHSKIRGVEGVEYRNKQGIRLKVALPFRERIKLPATQQVVYRMALAFRARYPALPMVLFLDNLFLTVALARALAQINIGVMGTTRKNADIPRPLIELGTHEQDISWGYYYSIIQHGVQVFLFKDNSAVLAITTAFNGQEMVLVPHNISKSTAVKMDDNNLNKVQPQPEFQPRPERPFPKALHQYNSNMNGVDLANQLRVSFTCHRGGDKSWWHVILYWLFDICHTNAYYIWKVQSGNTNHRFRHLFWDQLLASLLSYPQLPEVTTLADLEHRLIKLGKKKYCAHNSCQSRGERSFGHEISTNARRRSRQVITGCEACGVALCRKGSCWNDYHRANGVRLS